MRWVARARLAALAGGAALTLMGAGQMASSASADVQQGVHVERNIARDAGPVPYTAQATVTANGDESTVTITNPASNRDLGGDAIITAVELSGPDGMTATDPGNPDTPYQPGGVFLQQFPATTTIGGCVVANGYSLSSDNYNLACMFAGYYNNSASGGIAPGQSATITYKTSDPSKGNLLSDVSVAFDFDDLFPNCRPNYPGYNDALAIMDGQNNRFGYASDCAPPSKVRITSAKVNHRNHTAAFTQTASHATGFFCQLYKGRKLKFQKTCGATKRYTNRLPSGTYTYIVWGLNKHGRSPVSAFHEFRLK
jgi:hypothetical protein